MALRIDGIAGDVSFLLDEILHQIDCSDSFNNPTVRTNDACWTARDGAACQPWWFQNSILRNKIGFIKRAIAGDRLVVEPMQVDSQEHARK